MSAATTIAETACSWTTARNVGGVAILLKSKNKYGTIKEKREKNEIATTVVKCPYCGSEEVSLYGKSSTGAQRYLCRNKACSHHCRQLKAVVVEIASSNAE